MILQNQKTGGPVFVIFRNQMLKHLRLEILNGKVVQTE